MKEGTLRELRRELEVVYWRMVNMKAERARVIAEAKDATAKIVALKALLGESHEIVRSNLAGL